MTAAGTQLSSFLTNRIQRIEVSATLAVVAEAEKLRPAGNDDAILRWNTCVRFLSSHPEMQPRPEETPEPIVSE